MQNYKIGIVIADKDEYLPFADMIKKGKHKTLSLLKREALSFDITSEKATANVTAVFSGVGKVNAAAATATLANMGCNLIVNYGLSGGIGGVRKGDISLPDEYFEHDFDLSGIGYKPFEKPWQEYIYKTDERIIKVAKECFPYIKIGAAVSGDTFICDDEKRRFLRENFNGMSCDMETAAMASVCYFSDIPFISLRRISDNAGNDALEDYREMNTSGETLLSDMITELIKKLMDSELF